MRDAWLDLVLGTSCAACGRPGRLLCVACAGMLPTGGQECWPTPCPPGLALPVAAGDYDGALKLLINAHKERHHFALARPLGAVLAGVVEQIAHGHAGATGPWLLVPVPSRRSVVRGRGHDPLLRMTRQAAGRLRRGGVDAAVAPVLGTVGAARDQTGLHAAERAANLHATMACPVPSARRLRGRPRAGLVVVDDVLTTGSTAREAQRALEAAGLAVTAIATVAATRKRLRGGAPAPDQSPGLPISDRDD